MLTFLKEGKENLTYRMLAESVARTARGLVRAGLSQGETVAITATPNSEWIIAYLAVLRAGGQLSRWTPKWR